MRNRLTIANIISILLKNKKKTYQQHQLVRSLFSAYLNDELPSDEIYAEDNTMYSRLPSITEEFIGRKNGVCRMMYGAIAK